MKSATLILLFPLIWALHVVGEETRPAPETVDAEVARLKQRIAELESLVQTLEQDILVRDNVIATLTQESRKGDLLRPVPPEDGPWPLPENEPRPQPRPVLPENESQPQPDWPKFRFNGMDVYTIPLRDEPSPERRP